MPTVIAELCQNHNGDRAVLKDMVWAAAEAGADYAKVQTIRVRELTRREEFEATVREGAEELLRPYQPEYERLAKLELRPDDEACFREECARARIRPLTTAFTRAAVPELAPHYPDVKIASYDCASAPLLRDARARFHRLFVSTGASYDDEIERAAAVLRGSAFAFLHCVTIYPTPLDQLHLARMAWLRRLAPEVGFSDHTLVARDGVKASLAALALGADVIERHFTILPPDRTRDGPVSVDPSRLRELVEFSRLPLAERRREIETRAPEFSRMLGVEQRPLSDREQLNRRYYRGRFASRVGERWVYNWEEEAVS